MLQHDGSLRALEVHIFPEAMRGTGEGHYSWDLRLQSMMTNANVEQVGATVEGRTLTLKYKDGEQKIFVPVDTPVVAEAVNSSVEACIDACIARCIDVHRRTSMAGIALKENPGGVEPPGL
jgi:hypothetical protein